MADGKDFLEEMIDVWTEKDPSFRATFEAAWEQREERHKKPSDDLDTFIAERTAKNPVISSTYGDCVPSTARAGEDNA